MNKLTIKAKIQLIVFLSIAIVAAVIASQSIFSMKKLSKEKIEAYKIEAYKNKEKELENYVSVVEKSVESFYERTSIEKIQKEVEAGLKEEVDLILTVITSIYESNKNILSPQEVQNKIKQVIQDTRHGNDGYFWINDLDLKMVLHPTSPKLNGSDISKIKDTNNHYIFKDMVDIIKRKNEGTTNYLWSKPGFDTPQLKVSYVKLFKPYNWVIGTGEYVSDVTMNLQKEALKSISHMRYGKDGYFWINDGNAKMVMHPINPALDGKDLMNIQDPNGKYLFKEMTQLGNTKGQGLVKYAWNKPGKDKPQPKFSYIKKFGPWNWIIGTGAYVDEIEDNVNLMIENTNTDINNFIISILIGSTIALVLLLFISVFIAKKTILEPLEQFQEGLLNFFKYLNREASTVTFLNESSKDELGKMAKVVNKNISITKAGVE